MSALRNKVIWLTGASSGIGEALAYAFAKNGARIILSARRKEALERVKGNCPVSAQPGIRILPLDLRTSDTLQLSAQAAIQIFGHIDILVNNAGMRVHGRVTDTDVEMYRMIMEVNYLGTIALTKYLLPHFLLRKEGHFVTISSVTGIFGTPYRSAYAASKHALHGFFDGLRAEHHKDNIKVTMICPGFIQTSRPLELHASESEPASATRGKPASWCAQKIVSAIERDKQEVYIGGREVLGVYLKRFFPRLFSRVIRRVAVR